MSTSYVPTLPSEIHFNIKYNMTWNLLISRLRAVAPSSSISNAGLDDRKVRFKRVDDGRRAYCVVCSNVFLIVSVDNQPKNGQRRE